MKCRNCGVELSNHLECHLCGHKQVGQVKCSVCSKTIYPRQEYCSNCGSPTIYHRHKTVKKVTPDSIKHSESSHNYDTVTENYDYKANAYNYNEEIKKVIKKRTNSFKTRKSYSFNTTKSYYKVLAGIIIVILGIVTPLVVIGGFIDDSSDSYAEIVTNSELSDFVIENDTTMNEYNGNFNNGGKTFTYGNELYMVKDGLLVKYDKSFSEYDELYDDVRGYLFIDDRGIFYLNSYGDFILVNNGIKMTLLEDVDWCYVLDKDIFYLKDNNLCRLMLNDSNQIVSSKTIGSDIYDYCVDNVNKRLLYYKEDNLCLCDIDGNVIRDDIEAYSQYYFKDGLLYCRDYYGIYWVDLDSNEESLISEDDDYYRFNIVDSEDIIYVINFDNCLKSIENDDIYYLADGVREIYVVDDKVIFYTYDKDYVKSYYLADAYGSIALIEE